jgi:hypothetical protein
VLFRSPQNPKTPHSRVKRIILKYTLNVSTVVALSEGGALAEEWSLRVAADVLGFAGHEARA